MYQDQPEEIRSFDVRPLKLPLAKQDSSNQDMALSTVPAAESPPRLMSNDEKDSASYGQTHEAETMPGPSPSSQLQVEQSNETSHQHYPSGFKFTSIIAAVCLSFTLIGLDSTILATAVPTMTRYFGTIADIGWYTSVYRLTAGSFQFLFGKLYSLFPAKPIILLSLAVFAVGNLLCALAPSSLVFILGRAVTGFATAGVISGAFAMIIHSTPLRKRPTYAGIGGATEAIASLSAPLIGGLLTDQLTWRWCFFIQLPLTVVAFIMVMIFFDMSRRDDNAPNTLAAKIRYLDLLGTAFLVPSLTSLILALQWGGSKYGWSNWRSLTALGVFVLLAAAFANLQRRRQERATLPPRIILQRSVIFGFWFSCSNNAALSIIEYYMPIYFQTVKGLSAVMSGVMVLPSAAGLILSVSLSGFLTSHFGYYNPFMILTSVITPPAAGLMTTLNTDAKVWSLIFYQALLGFGAGIGFQGPQVAVQVIFSERDSQIGIAIIQFAQATGPAVFVAAAQTIFTSRLASNIRRYAPGVNLADLTKQGLTIPKTQADNSEYRGITLSYDKALTQTFYLSVSLACMSLIGALGIEWRSVKAKKP